MEYVPSRKEFGRLSKKGNLIPVYAEITADLETPVSAFMKIDRGDYSFLLESVEGGEKIARYSFLGSGPSIVFRSKGSCVEIKEDGNTKRFTASSDPLEEMKGVLGRYRFVHTPGLPRFCGGLVGFMGYDMVRFFEELPSKNPDDLNAPDSVFMLTDTILIFDHVKHKIKVVSNAHVEGDPSRAYDAAIKKINGLINMLGAPLAAGRRKIRATEPGIDSNFTKKEFVALVRKAKSYIRAGDIIQVVPSQRFSTKISCSGIDLYRSLRMINPSPYMYYLKMKEISLVGASPELMVRCEDNVVELRPIAGTRPRGRNEAEEKRLEKNLLSSVKERAEHIMLVDLGRNDIGRVCKYGTVKVSELMTIEKYSHVMHIVSECTGKLRPDKDMFDVIRATFPAGTVSGAPKVRAMEIIEELENTRRGPYAGLVGYFSFSGNTDTCINIRTIVMKGGRAFVQAGGGIVADSDPAKEYQETVNKAKATIKAIEAAEKGIV
ncbi:MAG TPA: anthranilate synthase component I [Candidatus Omnitrophota bacterium]|nr:anthranilate synthase component I [Candidatus Omnitrophota bacterium]HOX09743.1 anthranilate synthase component I [Candidatus Omnitrophota bacterium]